MSFGRYESIGLLAGDVVVFYLSLWLTLFVRNLGLPSQELWSLHFYPFTIMFGVWVLVFFIAGLYEQHTSFFKTRLPGLIIKTQISNIVIAALFFFLIPYFGITPKTNLLIYLVISSTLIASWRGYLAGFIGVRGRKNTLVLGEGEEIDELIREIDSNGRYGLHIIRQFALRDIAVSSQLEKQILEYVRNNNIQVILTDVRDPHMEKLVPIFYNLLFLDARLTFLDAARSYEQIFRRVPVSLLNERWFLEHITRQHRTLYNILHRAYDIVAGAVVTLVMMLCLPFVWIAVRLEDGGPLFIVQTRVGQNNKPIRIIKFRSMTGSDTGQALLKSTLRVTKTGNILRKTRVDELPQGISILKGDLSLVGPRPEFAEMIARYASDVPYYNARHLIKPGLSGWAQINHDAHPHHGLDVDKTRNKLSYDLYYLKNRSLMLDVEIALKTLKTLVTAVGK